LLFFVAALGQRIPESPPILNGTLRVLHGRLASEAPTHRYAVLSRGVPMAMLVIHDLPESVELDRQAMSAITGGSMVQAHQTLFTRRQTFTGFPQTTVVEKAESVGPFAGTGALRVHTTLLR